MTGRFRILYSPAAKQDLKGIYSYIAIKRKEKRTAETIVNRIRGEIRSLTDMAERYTRVDREPWASDGMHKFPVGNYVVFYRVDLDINVVIVDRIFYGGRDLDGLMGEGALNGNA